MSRTEETVPERTRYWLKTLIGFKTVSGSDSNLALLECVEAALARSGFRTFYSKSQDGARANLFASIGAGDGGLLLSGHTDVVPVAGQAWSRPAFELTEDAQRFYGRGTCDMKGFIASLLGAVEAVEAADLSRLGQPLHIALTYDEEIGCLGVRRLIEDLAAARIRPSACIVGEPTAMQVVRAHKGRQAYRCHVHGQAAHSSLSGAGVNALLAASRIVGAVGERADLLRQTEHDDGFYVPYSTMAPCRMMAGHANNVIPETAEFDFDLRFLPSTDPEAVMAPILDTAAAIEREMRSRVADASVRIERRTSVPALAPADGANGVAAMALQAGARPGRHVAFTTEGGLYQQAGIPAILCGPGDIAQAHTADEFIDKSQIAAAHVFFERLLALLGRG
ncbi:acetylornithine deacetylase (ArgE) [Cupriavidus sp. USMAHM13]|uniref:acetylornithine deacetylase n=1 Tax=Cupriavidus sp. USMAHM13 TaxID=1389192 RepID=UPI0008A6EBDE|nr:acetylornithine deacetylase [Cupriavidus sp. USMAHM13]AOY98834.1 acetylornithine deacetylase (ArgE) [Cupriavidus sp. USMAHM13]